MKLVEYKVETLDYSNQYREAKDRASDFERLVRRMSDDGWIYKEEIKLSDKESFHTYLFFRYDENFLNYNKELLQYLKP